MTCDGCEVYEWYDRKGWVSILVLISTVGTSRGSRIQKSSKSVKLCAKCLKKFMAGKPIPKFSESLKTALTHFKGASK